MYQITISLLLANFISRFSAAQVDSPRLCAELILSKILGLNRAQIIAFPERELDHEMASQCERLATRREQGEPMAYILGCKEFYGINFIVSPAVLVPRPETELIVDLVKQEFAQEQATSASLRFADLGTGSGCLATTILLAYPHWQGLAVDISAQALAIAQQNISAHGLENRCLLMQADFTNLPLRKHSLQLIVSNPPYIPTKQYQNLNPEVRCFEPELALHSGADGLDHPRKIIKTAQSHLAPGGILLMEIGDEQGEAVLNLLNLKCWFKPQIIKDLAGHDRVAMARKA